MINRKILRKNKKKMSQEMYRKKNKWLFKKQNLVPDFSVSREDPPHPFRHAVGTAAEEKMLFFRSPFFVPFSLTLS